MSTLIPTTELEAVNRILASIGEGRVSTLTGTIPADASKARDRLTEVSRELQKVGYTFNTDSELPLTPIADGTVSLSPSALKVVFIGETDLVIRGQRVYDRVKRTYNIARTPKADVTVFLPYNELPETARAYVFLKAGRSFQDDETGDSSIHRIMSEDVNKAWRDFVDWDVEQNKYSLRTNPMIQRINQRRPVTH